VQAANAALHALLHNRVRTLSLMGTEALNQTQLSGFRLNFWPGFHCTSVPSRSNAAILLHAGSSSPMYSMDGLCGLSVLPALAEPVAPGRVRVSVRLFVIVGCARLASPSCEAGSVVLKLRFSPTTTAVPDMLVAQLELQCPARIGSNVTRVLGLHNLLFC
jgi:hypothetical protein